MKLIKKTVCYTLLLTITGQSLCSDSWWSRFTNYLSSWKNSAIANAASSTGAWIKQNPGKTTLAIGGLTAAGVACYLYGNKKACNKIEQKSEQPSDSGSKEHVSHINPELQNDILVFFKNFQNELSADSVNDELFYQKGLRSGIRLQTFFLQNAINLAKKLNITYSDIPEGLNSSLHTYEATRNRAITNAQSLINQLKNIYISIKKPQSNAEGKEEEELSQKIEQKNANKQIFTKLLESLETYLEYYGTHANPTIVINFRIYNNDDSTNDSAKNNINLLLSAAKEINDNLNNKELAENIASLERLLSNEKTNLAISKVSLQSYVNMVKDNSQKLLGQIKGLVGEN